PTRAVIYTLSLHDALPIFDAKRVKKFGHRQNDLGCNFVVTFNNGKRIIVRAKKDDHAMKRQNGTRHVQILGGEIKARWDCDAGVDRKSTRLNSSHVKISYA